MEIRQITPQYAVSPQIDASDLPALAQAGITRVICNRPDSENPQSRQHAAMQDAAQTAGVEYVYHPLTHTTMSPENVAKQQELAAAAPGPVLAYCASGTRSSVAWALSRTGAQDVDEILGATRAAGYDLEGLRPALNAMHKNGS